MGMPTKTQIKQVLKKLEKSEDTLALPANPSPLAKFRFDIQQKFVSYILKTKISQREMAKLLGIDKDTFN